MKIERPDKEHLELGLSPQDKQMLGMLLRLYPQVPTGSWRLSKNGGLKEDESNQALLEESHAEARQQHRQAILAWLNDGKRLRPASEGFVLRLTNSEAEALLQILNDIRVGSWMALGSPQKRLTRLTDSNAPHVWAMELSTLFQVELLEAMDGA